MGFAAGFQAGSQVVERALRRQQEEELKRNLSQESDRYNVTEGAYGPGLQENINQLQGLREQDPAQAPAYDQAIAELTRRQGLTAPDYSVASGATNYATREEARQVAAPMRTEGLSNVYRQAGMIDKADELENRAFERRQAVTAEARAAQDFATNQTIKGLAINQAARTEGEQQRFTDFSNFAAERPDATVEELKKAAFTQFKFTPKQWQDTVTTRLGIENAEMDSFKNGVKKKLQGKNLTQVGSLYNSDPAFDDKTDLAIVPGKNGAVTLNFIDKASKRITGTQTFKNEALALEYLNIQATQPEILGTWMVTLNKAEAAINASNASAGASAAASNASNANVGLTNARANQVKAQTKILDANVANNEEARKVLTQMAALDFDADPAAAQKLAGLQAQFNVANASPGKTVPGGGGGKTNILKQPVEQKINNDGTYTAFSKDGGQALYNTFNGLPIPLGMTLQTFEEMKKLAVQNGVTLEAGEDGGVLKLKYAGKDGQFYDDPVKAKRAKPAPAPEKSNAKTGIDTTQNSKVASGLETPPVKKVSERGNIRYTIEGLSKSYNSEAEAKKAWAKSDAAKDSKKLSFNDD